MVSMLDSELRVVNTSVPEPETGAGTKFTYAVEDRAVPTPSVDSRTSTPAVHLLIII